MSARSAIVSLLLTLAAATVILASGAPGVEPRWRELAAGLELARFSGGQVTDEPAGAITILRIDPRRWSLVFRGISISGGQAATARGWCEREGLTAAINAGMFDTDFRTHIGFLRDGDHKNSGRRNRYLSAAAFGPIRTSDPPFRLFDLDDTPFAEVDSSYRTVLQNLRVIKRGGTPVWKSEGRRWSEAALGEDSDGRPLFVFSRRPVAMDEFAEALLKLPIGLTALQHLEGGAQAQMFVKAGGTSIELTGVAGEGPEIGMTGVPWPIPNVLGIVPRR
jgi:hypothetical protein